MIKLEDLKIGDKVYCVCSDGFSWHGGLTIHKELLMLDRCPKPLEAVLCEGSIEVLTRNHEKYLFRTLKEVEDSLKELQLVTAKELLNSEKFIDRLFECATSAKRLSRYGEIQLYELAIKLYKENSLK
jgi:hypothetical protein